MSKYGEPWEFKRTFADAGDIRLSHSRIVSASGNKWGTDDDFPANRIVACVNACEGIDDPQAEIPEMRRLAVAMKICLSSLCVQYSGRHKGLFLSGKMRDVPLNKFTVEEILAMGK